MVWAVISNPVSFSVRSSTCRPSGTDGIEGFDIGIALPSGHHVNQRPNHLAAPKVRMNPKHDPGINVAIPLFGLQKLRSGWGYNRRQS